jgi:hypothetical protein
MSDKQKKKLIDDLRNYSEKLDSSLSELKDNLIKLENGEDNKHAYWNGENAYDVIKRLHSLVDNGFAIDNYIKECGESIKK